MFPVSLLNLASIAPILPICGNLLPFASTSSILLNPPYPDPGRPCIRGSGLGDVEINPHHAVVGQGREDVPLLDQAALLLVQAVDDAVERCLDVGKVQFGLRQLRLGLGLGQLGPEQRHLFGETTFFSDNFLVLSNSSCASLASAISASSFAL